LGEVPHPIGEVVTGVVVTGDVVTSEVVPDELDGVVARPGDPAQDAMSSTTRTGMRRCMPRTVPEEGAHRYPPVGVRSQGV